MERKMKILAFVLCVLLLGGILLVELGVFTPAIEAMHLTVANTEADAIITLHGDRIEITDPTSATIDGSVIRITRGGRFDISGTLYDGQIIVDIGNERATLFLNGVDITCSDSAPIYVARANRVRIELAIGTENTVTDGEIYFFPQPGITKPNAAIYSRDDLTISGEGSLTVNANFNNGISSQNDLRISGGTITITAHRHAIRGRQSVTIERGRIFATSLFGHGIRTDDIRDTGRGFVLIEGGKVSIDAFSDGINADNLVVIRQPGEVEIRADRFPISTARTMIDDETLIILSP